MKYFSSQLFSNDFAPSLMDLVNEHTERYFVSYSKPISKIPSFLHDFEPSDINVKLCEKDFDLAHKLYLHPKNIFKADAKKRKIKPQKGSRRLIPKYCQCCAKTVTKHKCPHTHCQRPCEKLERALKRAAQNNKSEIEQSLISSVKNQEDSMRSRSKVLTKQRKRQEKAKYKRNEEQSESFKIGPQDVDDENEDEIDDDDNYQSEEQEVSSSSEQQKAEKQVSSKKSVSRSTPKKTKDQQQPKIESVEKKKQPLKNESFLKSEDISKIGKYKTDSVLENHNNSDFVFTSPDGFHNNVSYEGPEDENQLMGDLDGLRNYSIPDMEDDNIFGRECRQLADNYPRFDRNFSDPHPHESKSNIEKNSNWKPIGSSESRNKEHLGNLKNLDSNEDSKKKSDTNNKYANNQQQKDPNQPATKKEKCQYQQLQGLEEHQDQDSSSEFPSSGWEYNKK